MKPCLLCLVPAASLFVFSASPGAARAGDLDPLATAVKAADLDPAAFADWVDGLARAMPQKDGPRHVVWTRDTAPEWDGAAFGDSKIPGPRHLRIGFASPLQVGSVLVRGGGQLSALRPGAAYPGDPADEAQWAPAQRLVKGRVGDGEVSQDEYAVWVFPKAFATRALRFTHTARPTDTAYAGWLGGACVLADRLSNVAPQALARTDVNGESAARINDQTNNGCWNAWDNGPDGGPQAVSPEHPVDVVLAWPREVSLCGLNALWAGFAAADVQRYRGPADRPPREATEADWETIKTFDKIQNQYPRALGVNWMDFGRTVSTRAIRLRITKCTTESHPHLNGNTKQGKRVWLGELLALQPLGDADLSTAILTPPVQAAVHPPIPVRFTLQQAGFVTLVIEDSQGLRVRNLISQTRLPAGQNVIWWDGTDDLGRDPEAARHGVYRIPGRLVAPGEYRVRGLVHTGIDLRYEFSVYNGGSPAWPTADHTGGWLTNHTPPSSALFVPGDPAPGVSEPKRAGPDVRDANQTPRRKPMVYLGSYVSEGGDGLAWVDLDGRKQGGVGWVGGVWTGAPYLARDAGPSPAPAAFAYAGSAWEGELRLTALTRSGDKPVVKYNFPGGKDASVLTGLAVHNGLMACSLPKQREILFVDAKAGKVLGSASVDDPRGLAFDPQGRLLVLIGRQLQRYAIRGTIPIFAAQGAAREQTDASAAKMGLSPSAPNVNKPLPLPAAQVIVADGLEDPQHVVQDDEGNFYVSDRGASHQVKVFDAAGKRLRTIGTPGAPKAGPYDPNHMNNPNGLTIDERRQLWVAETDFQPKRVSVWTLEGKLLKAFYGPAEYGGGGGLDPGDKTRFYYHGMEFKLDWRRGRDRLVRVFFRPGPDDLALPSGFGTAGQPETPLEVKTPSGTVRRYFTNCYNSNPTNGASVAFLWIDRQGIARPVAALGQANDWDLLKGDAFKPRWPKGVDLAGDRWRNQALFVWSDLNGDGRVQPEEVTMVKAAGGGVTVMPDLAFVVSRIDDRAFRLAPQRFTPQGVPVYDLAAGETLAAGSQPPTSSGGDQALVDPSGWTILTVAPKPFAPQSLGGVFRGQARWSYPSLWPGLHASHESPPPDRPGELIGTTRLLGGFVTPGGDAGPLWAVNGNQGNIYLFTADGLFVAELFRDIRKGEGWAMPLAQRGMLLNDVSLHDENFWPSIAQTSDGEVYLVDGARTSLVRVDGLAVIRRLPPMRLEVTADDLRHAQACLVQSEAQRQKFEGRPTLKVALRTTPPAVDGKLDDWAGADWATIDKSGVAAFFDSHSKPYDVTAAVVVAGDRLYAAFRTGDAQLLHNSGETPRAPFKTGGCLDLMIGADSRADANRTDPVPGDLRLLVTLVHDKPLALLYRAVVPGTKEPVPFSSPWRTITIDRVDDVSDQLRFAAHEGNYELSIPLSLLNLKPVAGQVLQGDLGILRGNGFETLERVYWSNKATAITSDVPSEAQLTPRLWGRWVLEAAK
jgi:hypothetical protein